MEGIVNNYNCIELALIAPASLLLPIGLFVVN